MKLIISGSRDIPVDVHLIEDHLRNVNWEWDTLIFGDARGVDAAAESYAKEKGIPHEVFQADWDTYGKSAGPRRNREMAEHGDALLAIWDGSSKGTKNMIDQALGRNLPTHVEIYRDNLL